MSEYTILTVNPGSTGTKIGLVRGDKVILDLNVDSKPEDFKGCKTFADQLPLREKLILDQLTENHVDLSEIDAVSGRGVGIHSCVGGTYLIDDLAVEHSIQDVEGINHPATMGISLAKNIADKLGKKAYFVNPMSTDELCDCARMTGIRGIYRPSHAHPLNMKEVAIHHSQLQGKRYEECNYVILHMGGGTSIAAHQKGKAIDQTRIGDGQGPISPNRAGDFCFGDVITLAKERNLTLDEIRDLCSRKGGFVDLLGTDDMRKIRGEMIPSGNKFAQLCVNAMEYTMVKWAGQMAAVLKGNVDAILLTGGLAYDKELVEQLTEDLKWIAPVYAYPGSFETEALASGVIRVLTGQEEVKHYTGRPVFTGFDM